MNHTAAPSVAAAQPKRWSLDPVLMMFVALAIAVALTWLIPSGAYERDAKGLVIPHTFHHIDKSRDLAAMLPSKAAQDTARPASPIAIVTAIPAGMARAAALIAMLLFLGGMFGVLRATGALEAAIVRLATLTRGRAGLITPLLMVAISAGSTFLGLVSEYLVIIPMMLSLSRAMGLQPLFGFALVTVAAKIGYLCSVTNPVALLVAQPIVGVPVFSGFAFRFALWVVFLSIGIAFVMRLARQPDESRAAHDAPKLTPAQRNIMLVLAAGTTVLVCGSALLHWHYAEFSAVYIGLAALLALIARMRPATAVHHFVHGMQSMMLAGLLVGMAVGVEIVLRDGRVLDSLIHSMAAQTKGMPPVLVGHALMGVEIVLTLLIPSTSAKAALSMPILGPIAQMADVTGQSTVLAFLLGNGLVNTISPTSGMLLAFLATGGISYGQWFRFALPLVALLAVLSLGVMAIAVLIHY
ncbi:hypothetical protein [Roseiterribacter gracilis]|uniref:C4-dicarboxylate ABC transporter n=1 Tax=Roseiterribacter gracilis TaxID=2812848 RepID=A0A8S8XFT4_9PROT|nr:hypothetical protein TMPK1_30680 [Rhodospirillales bacterium TMPK1]